MRILLLLLLLANLLFFAWSKWVAPPPVLEGSALPSSRDPAAVRLIRESGAVAEPSPAAAAGGSPATLAGSGCVSAGPYPDQSRAEQAAANLSGLGFEVSLRPAVDDVPVGQWLRVGGLATPEDAANTLASLQAAGFADAVMMTDEHGEAVVSLGVFADPGRVTELSDKVREAGFTPVSSPRTRKARVFWLDIDTAASAGLPALEDLGSADLPEGTLGLQACPTAGEPAPEAGEAAPQPEGAAAGAEADEGLSRDGSTPESAGPG